MLRPVLSQQERPGLLNGGSISVIPEAPELLELKEGRKNRGAGTEFSLAKGQGSEVGLCQAGG